MGISFYKGLRVRLTIISLLLMAGGCSDSTDPTGIILGAKPVFPPGEVREVRVGHGPGPGEVVVSWLILSWATNPIKEYLVAASSEGPITEENWDQAMIMGRHPWAPGQVRYGEIYGSAEGLTQGQSAWFAVRARDEMGNLSPLNVSLRWTLTSEWWIEGQVNGLFGEPVPEVTVRSVWTDMTARTDGEGFFRIGPLRSVDRIKLVTGSPLPTGPDGSWYGYAKNPINPRPGQLLVTGQDFFLLPRFARDSRCTDLDYEFLGYLIRMTFTAPRQDDPSATILHRWEQYPLSVYIPSFENEAGVPMDQGALIALLLWNTEMGEDYFVRTDDQESAAIEFRFEELINAYGTISLLLPAGPDVKLGRVIPRKMAVTIDPQLDSTISVAEVSLHEFGHTLGLIMHSNCQAAGYLMNVAGGFGSLDKAEPIHLDERRAVKCIRYLPQNQDMTRFRVE